MWVSNIQASYFDIEYVKGNNNVVVDSLSRRPYISLMDVVENWKAILEVGYAKDKFSCELFDGNNHDDRYKVFKGIIYYKYRIYFGPVGAWKFAGDNSEGFSQINVPN